MDLFGEWKPKLHFKIKTILLLSTRIHQNQMQEVERETIWRRITVATWRVFPQDGSPKVDIQWILTFHSTKTTPILGLVTSCTSSGAQGSRNSPEHRCLTLVFWRRSVPVKTYYQSAIDCRLPTFVSNVNRSTHAPLNITGDKPWIQFSRFTRHVVWEGEEWC